MKDLVSIIIPAYNRAHLIGETLDSVRAQTYQNWECIVVDDGSSDYTEKLLGFYTERDNRIKFYHRPTDRKKGANACRNIGFKKSKGTYIIWFDSDDLMTPDHIEAKVTAIGNSKTDFVIAQTQNFKNNELLEVYKYNKKENGITASDFILLKIHWYTCDVLLKRKIAKQILWNEKMKSWQDYNYFCKILLATVNGSYLDKILTHRRIHSNSIQKSLNKNPNNFNKELLDNRVLTYRDISEIIDAPTQKELLYGMMNLCFEIAKQRNKSSKILEVAGMVNNLFGFNSKFYFSLSLISARITGKGHYFLDKAKIRD